MESQLQLDPLKTPENRFFENPVSTPGVKKKKPSPSRLRRNQRRMRIFLERNKSAGSGEPDISGIKVTSAGELPASKGADSNPVTKPDCPALSTLETREDVSKQIPSAANTEEEGTDDDMYSTQAAAGRTAVGRGRMTALRRRPRMMNVRATYTTSRSLRLYIIAIYVMMVTLIYAPSATRRRGTYTTELDILDRLGKYMKV